MMVGFHDRQAIRERGPATPARGSAQPAPQEDPNTTIRFAGKPRPRQRRAQNAEMQKAEQTAKGRLRPPRPAERKRSAGRADGVPDRSLAGGLRPAHRCHHRRAQERKCAGVLGRLAAAARSPPTAAAVYLNELYRARAERAGIIYVDIWDGFVDEAGRYILQGPDFEGQTRRLRSGDGIYFTARRPQARALCRARNPAQPASTRRRRSRRRRGAAVHAGPATRWPVRVVPLTASTGGGNELLGAAPTRPSGVDPLATRVLVRGEPITAPAGRADNFAWPKSGVTTIREGEPEETPAPAQQATPAPQAPPQAAPQQQPPRPPLRTSTQTPPTQQQPAQPQQQTPGAPRPKAQQQQQPPGRGRAAGAAAQGTAARKQRQCAAPAAEHLALGSVGRSPHRCARSVSRMTSAS